MKRVVQTIYLKDCPPGLKGRRLQLLVDENGQASVDIDVGHKPSRKEGVYITKFVQELLKSYGVQTPTVIKNVPFPLEEKTD